MLSENRQGAFMATEASGVLENRRRAAVIAVLLTAALGFAADKDPPQKVQFAGADGFFIHADFYPAPSNYTAAPIVILLHDHGQDRSAWDALVPRLREEGMSLLVPDLRGHGLSATTETAALRDEHAPRLYSDIEEDLLGAYTYLARQQNLDRARFAIVAAGRMCGPALCYALEDRSVDAVLLLSPEPPTPESDLAGDLGQLAGRCLVMIDGESGRDTFQRFQERAAHLKSHIADAQARGTTLLTAVPGLDRTIRDHLVRSMGPPAAAVVYGSIQSNIYHLAGSGWIDEIHPTNLRLYSSPAEAEARGLRASKSKGPRKKSRK